MRSRGVGGHVQEEVVVCKDSGSRRDAKLVLFQLGWVLFDATEYRHEVNVTLMLSTFASE
jgi:hypothetical protein